MTAKEKQEAQFYAQKLKYPKGALIFNGSGEEDFLYCLPAEHILAEETGTAAPEAFSEAFDYILRHASGKELTAKEKQEAQFYAQKLKYPKGALIFNGSGEEDFLYCLPDSKEISVCREMSKSFGFPTLEDGLSVLSKNELADNLAYNSLKVKK